MRNAHRLWAWVPLLGVGIAVAPPGAQTSTLQGKELATAERDVRAFYESYAEDLRHQRRDAIVDRYDPRGVYFMGHGAKTFKSLESVRSHYQTRWTGPKSFEWRDLTFEVVSPDAAVALGRFAWQGETGDTIVCSYTGLLIKQQGKWRIRVEDESRPLPKPSAK